MKNLVIIKLGGSIITDKKATKPVFRKSVVKRICGEIFKAQKQANISLILVHGAGSFGHPYAKKYRLNEGYFGKESSLGISLTKKFVLELNLRVVNEMISSGLNAVLVESSAVAITSNGKIETFNQNPIEALLKQDIIPVLSGDVVTDSKKGVSILSGDQIAVYLASKLRAKTVIFASDVDGIFDKNPKLHKDAKLIKEINNSNYEAIVNTIQTHNTSDVTGEMKGKIMTIRENLSGVPVIITNGLKPANIKHALLNRINGTRILF